MAAPKQTDPQFKLRLTPGLKEFIEAEAEKSGRSMNAEILHRLELTRRFDLDVGENYRSRSELGPMGAFIEDQSAGIALKVDDLRTDVSKLKEQLAQILKAISK